MEELLKISQLQEELLDIVYNADEYTTSDLQGVIEARIRTNCKLD